MASSAAAVRQSARKSEPRRDADLAALVQGAGEGQPDLPSARRGRTCAGRGRRGASPRRAAARGAHVSRAGRMIVPKSSCRSFVGGTRAYRASVPREDIFRADRFVLLPARESGAGIHALKVPRWSAASRFAHRGSAFRSELHQTRRSSGGKSSRPPAARAPQNPVPVSSATSRLHPGCGKLKAARIRGRGIGGSHLHEL